MLRLTPLFSGGVTVECMARRGWLTVERPSKRDVVRSLLSATDNETVEQDVERDYNKLARHPKGIISFVICLHKFSGNSCVNIIVKFTVIIGRST